MGKNIGRFAVILSTERSGSTLLTAMLGGNRHVVAPPEMHLFRFGEFGTWRRCKPDAIASLAWLMRELGQSSDEPYLVSRFSGRPPDAVYEELLQLCGPARLLVDKTPAYARDDIVLKRIEALEPFYIWLVRHPLGVVASSLDRRQQRYLTRRGKTSSVFGKAAIDLKRAIDQIWYLRGPYLRQKLRYWGDIHSRTETFLATVPAERSLKIHFENLVRAPEKELNRICAALGLDLEPAMLHPGNNVPTVLAWGLGNEKVLTHATIDPSVADRWRQRLDERVLDKRTRVIMARLGSGAQNS